MTSAVKPASETELSEFIRAADAPVEIIGTATKRGLGRPVQAAATLDMSGFSGVIAYEPEELILDVGTATPLSQIEHMLAERGQQLAFEPPDWSALLGSAHSGTLGGLVSCNLSGPRRIAWGAMRDHVMGVRAVNGTAEAIHSGGRVLKNVTGLDLSFIAALTSAARASLTRSRTDRRSPSTRSAR